MPDEALHVAFNLATLEPGRAGGSEINAAGVLSALRQDSHGLQVTTVATTKVREAYGDAADSPHVRFITPRFHPGASTASRRLAALVLDPLLRRTALRGMAARPDVVHYPLTVISPTIPGAVVVTLFDLNHHDLAHLWSTSQRAYRRLVYDAAARRADVVITASAHARGRIVNLLDVEPDRIRVIPLGIDREVFSAAANDDDERTARRLGLPERFVYYPAALLPHKNHRLLLEAMARIEDRTLHLVLTGPGLGGLASLRQSVAELGLSDRVHHLGYRPRSDVPVLLRRSVALVFPSLYEGFGTPPLEAMACGTPVVSSLCASLRDVCEGAVCVVEPRDVDSVIAAIDAVTRDDRLRRDLVARGTERVAGYTWSAAAAAHADAYRLASRLRS